jgi:hypothetical protein
MTENVSVMFQSGGLKILCPHLTINHRCDPKTKRELVVRTVNLFKENVTANSGLKKEYQISESQSYEKFKINIKQLEAISEEICL